MTEADRQVAWLMTFEDVLRQVQGAGVVGPTPGQVDEVLTKLQAESHTRMDQQPDSHGLDTEYERHRVLSMLRRTIKPGLRTND